MKHLVTIILVFGLGLSFTYPVQALTDSSPKNQISAFSSYREVILPNELIVPQVVDVSLDFLIDSKDQLALYEITNAQFIPFELNRSYSKTTMQVESNYQLQEENKLVDNNRDTYVEYPVTETKESSVKFHLTYAKPITSNGFAMELAPGVTPPKTISIKILDTDSYIVLGTREYQGLLTEFPRTTAAKWEVELTYDQPLRITDFGFSHQDQYITSLTVRFLGRKEEQYRLYTWPNRKVNILTGESSNLQKADTPSAIATLGDRQSNNLYQMTDQDNDRIIDTNDNCPQVSNHDQEDINNNHIGDACEDFDLDGVLNVNDNCLDVANRYQQDEDGDGIGDHCDKLESRLTERLFWLPWAGIIVGFGVVLGLLYTTASWFTYIKKPDTKI